MAHLPPNAAIFSPSVARAAASAAKDWSFIDAWLSRKFPGRSPPPFERNADTLRALLALASANEAADEERALVARLEAETAEQLSAHDQSEQTSALQDARAAILTSLESSLTREGQTALNAMAALALQSGIPLPTPAALGAELIALTTQSLALEQTISRIQTLTAHITHETSVTAALATELRPPSPNHDHDHDHDPPAEETDPPRPTAAGYHPPATLALQNLSAQRRIKALSARIPELRDRAAAVASTTNTPHPSIAQVRAGEEAYRSLLAQKTALDAQVQAFAGLPPDTAQARHALEGLGAELRRLEARRDEVFEGLVERETPRKGGVRR
ncbi:hypothetical protein BT67DRAFT_233645 [Trichocladium antarcticum]|uniref:HAUS augmin-like complex subunit 1 n=1 Tax=Trichocladium antarcticum TaxID=1450529 RepID=A0AAN6ZFR1_9PEZI|nr:hypothetical protein BT67DRAFT_233645 [Trichocladium antarcticum]